MAEAKWWKLGAAAVLSVSMLSACGSGDGDDDNIEVEDPATDEEDQDSDIGTDTEEELEDDTNEEKTRRRCPLIAEESHEPVAFFMQKNRGRMPIKKLKRACFYNLEALTLS
ncbi:hypothetical protein FK545_13305 [Planococcus glaciei]|nr:hypothetical protein [Planococcus glaciei]QDY46037.1 hypothetical protein FK545_13305 [Planococcus glaciei]